MSAAVARAFDSIAPSYDDTFTNSGIGGAQRRAVWQVTDRVFVPGDRVLEINCGTGVDAVHLAQQGVRVHACDVSEGMVEIARQRVAMCNCHVQVELRAAEELGALNGVYDGLLSNFGGLNCIDDLAELARSLSRLIRHGGSVVLCYMGRFCAWEAVWYLLHGLPAKAFRRFAGRGGTQARLNSTTFNVRYPSVKEVQRAFAPAFRLVEYRGIGMFVPPSYVEPLAAKHPRLLKMAAKLDHQFAAWPLLRAMSDHVLLRFEKVNA